MPIDPVVYAKRGWKLFPARWDAEKRRHIGLIKWASQASSDPETVAGWRKRWPDAYFCVALTASDLTVLDVDMKNGKNGMDSLLELTVNSDNDFPTTLTAETPSGGRHYFFKGACAHTVSKIGKGLDTPVMVPIPGSLVPEKGEYRISHKSQPAPVPLWLRGVAGAPKERDENSDIPLVELDQDHNIAAAIQYAKNAEAALQGSGGNDTTYRVACAVRDFGVSEKECLDILLEHWYPNCEPSNKPEFVERLVENAYRYALDRAGNASIEAVFPESQLSNKIIRSARDIEAKSIRPRRWILGRRYIRGFVTVTVAAGGTGKSLLTILESLAIATGRPLSGDQVYDPGPVWMYNTEDPFDELDRRISANMVHYRIPQLSAAGLYYSSGYENPIKLVVTAKGANVVNEKAVQAIIREIKARDVRLFVIDPFIRVHSVNENDNSAVDLVVQQLTRIAKEGDCAVSVVHHTPKGAKIRGNADAARGASSLVSAARVAHTVFPMDAGEAKKYGLTEKEANWYVRLDDAKANLAPPTNKIQWFKKNSVPLFFDSNETVGVLSPENLVQVLDGDETEEFALTVASLIQSGETKTVYQVVKDILDFGILTGSDKTIRKQIAKVFTGGYEAGGKKIEYFVQPGNRNVHVLSCE